MHRRAAGGTVPDTQVLAAHPDLMPELGEELRLLAMLERARGAREAPPAPGLREIPGYRLIRELHRGGQGLVYESEHVATGRRVAVKVMRDAGWADEHSVDRFRQEVRILGDLEHPGIVKVLSSGTHEGRFYYVMDFVDGVPLDTYAVGCPLQRKLVLMA